MDLNWKTPLKSEPSALANQAKSGEEEKGGCFEESKYKHVFNLIDALM